MCDEDYLLALQLQKEWNQQADGQLNVAHENQNLNTSAKRPKTSVVDPEWEITDPNPDIHSLFGVFNVRFFWNALGAVEIKWSPRMYTCAGICTYKGRAGCIVSLSLPLLKYRPRKDLIETLLHEMIHAYLFVTKNNKDRVSHGAEFCKHMKRINKEAGTRITIYHSFHDEVNHYKTHVWRCNGKCQADPPFFGYVRRAINRAPAPSDFWFDDHFRKCGGTFRKVSEPDNFKSRQNKKDVDSQKSTTSSAKKQKDLKNFFSSTPKNTPERKLGKTATSTNPSVKPFVSTSGVAVRPVQPTENLSDGLVKHGGVKNNIVGFGNLSGGAPSTSVKSEKKDNFAVPTVPFSGKGYVLGSGGSNDRTKSRLLHDAGPIQISEALPSISSASSSDKKQKAEVVYSEDLTNLDFSEDFDSSVTDLTSQDSSDEEELSDLKCPVCCERLNKNVSINEHLDECSLLEKVVNSSRHDNLIDSDSDSDDNKPTGLDESLSDDEMSVDSPVSRAGPFVDCPHCNSRVEASIINQHLDQCLIFE